MTCCATSWPRRSSATPRMWLACSIVSAPMPEQLHPPAFERLARDLGSTPAQLRQWVSQGLDGVHQHLPELLRTAQDITGPSEYAAALTRVIAEQTRHLRRAATPQPTRGR